MLAGHVAYTGKKKNTLKIGVGKQKGNKAAIIRNSEDGRIIRR